MTDYDILQTALMQSAVDSGAIPDDFLAAENIVVLQPHNPQSRAYLRNKQSSPWCDLVSYGNNVVASVSPELKRAVNEYLCEFSEPYNCFEMQNVYALNDRLKPFGLGICYAAQYFLPKTERLKPLYCSYSLRLMTADDFSNYYLPQWSNALCKARSELDVIALGAFDGDKLVGLAGASADCETMWQIGVDVLPEYRRQGIASCLTSRLAIEILQKGIVPFYSCAWSNVKSAANAVKCGFVPTWVQMTAKPLESIDK